ncbi:MAG: superoxide dismutase [Candidatus Lloydbacteria bacterium CG22_combo_CG10-13_8_21_14_all_47_15]|uniref:superoxide dismutase n=1 Tax=Candidatus Lloydbacteria bacterium CG22_combo_CG10-13_8_21_14_all_47_15 TaxID=1974635 RepID=A0A2H0CVH0_9BACT|nr:MAG: superoxide dismutase [Candidatus Lloydbacteria bacterium CG22_combo_CG10-13_8_21_14_all_47_15]
MYTARDFSSIIGVSGFSDTLLKAHFGLYDGYVKNTNLLVEKLAGLEPSTPEYAELKRRFGWEFNGMRLHELYFENMAKDVEILPKDSGLYRTIVDHFGSYEAWEKDFKATGALRGIGWVILAYDREGGTLFNIWVGEHDIGHLAGAVPILVMDVFEHAFIMDYGMKRKEYIDTFFGAINWDVVSGRFST